MRSLHRNLRVRCRRGHYQTQLETLPQSLQIVQAFQAEGLSYFLGFPLIAQQELMGTLKVWVNPLDPLTAEQIASAQEVADQLAIAVQQYRLQQQLVQYTSQLEERVAERTLELQDSNAELQVQEIVDAAQFEQVLAQGNFDLVITDYQLGWTDGLIILRDVKARYPDCPVVMFTGTGNEEVAVEAMKAGLDDYIIKSAKHYARLAVAVRGVLNRAMQRQALQEAENRYQRLFEGVPVGLYRMTPTGQILEANSALLQILGHTNLQALSTPPGRPPL